MKTINKGLLPVVILCFALPASSLAKIYKWVDGNGQVHYSSTPPVATAERQAQEVNVRGAGGTTFKSSKKAKEPEKTSERKPPSSEAQKSCVAAVSQQQPVVFDAEDLRLLKAHSQGKVRDIDLQAIGKKMDAKQEHRVDINICLEKFDIDAYYRRDILRLLE